MKHHANLIVGKMDWALTHIPQELQNQSPDVSLLLFDRMTIADVRALISSAGLKPVSHTHRVFIIKAESILGEAQNALLKILEDPNPTSLFYLIVPREDQLLPTLRSRLNLLGREESRREENDEFLRFYKAGYADRLSMIAERIKEEDGDWIRELIRGFEYHAHMKRDKKLMREVLKTESYLEAAGSSKKMLLEHLALTL
jgi:DNA polymerase III delta prime subunit